MQTKKRIVAVAAMLLAAGAVQAAITIETVPVGNAGNASDTRYETPGYGSVGYTYNIGKYEVTAGQYTEFLNNVGGVDGYGLYNTSMSNTSYGSGIARSGGGTGGDPYTYSVDPAFATRPVNYVSYWDACRFANWLHNGQGSGDTEMGAYTLTTDGMNSNTAVRNGNWKWAVTSEDEWYKAAYHKNDGVTGNYFDFPTSSNTAPGRDMADASGNNANYYGYGAYPIDAPYYTTVVGEFQKSDSPYGTFDQGGNVWEWTEAILNNGSNRGLRGGSFNYNDVTLNSLMNTCPASEDSYYGFRVSEVPEPASMAILALGGLGMLVRRRGVRG